MLSQLLALCKHAGVQVAKAHANCLQRVWYCALIDQGLALHKHYDSAAAHEIFCVSIECMHMYTLCMYALYLCLWMQFLHMHQVCMCVLVNGG